MELKFVLDFFSKSTNNAMQNKTKQNKRKQNKTNKQQQQLNN